VNSIIDIDAHFNRKLTVYTNALLLLFPMSALVYSFCLLFWGLNRGFDIMDEGYYLLNSKYVGQFDLVSGFPYFLSHIPTFSTSRILDFRSALVCASIVGAIVFGIGFLAWLQKVKLVVNGFEYLSGLLFGVMGNLLIFAKFPFSISYNSLTGLFLFSSTGLILLISARNERETLNIGGLAGVLLAGSLAGFCLFVKFSAWLVFVPSAIALIILLEPRNKARFVLWFVCGIAASMIAYFAFIEQPHLWLQPILDWLNYLPKHRELHSSLLQTYFNNITGTVLHFYPALEIFSLCIFTVFFLLAKKQAQLGLRKWRFIALVLHTVTSLLVTAWCLSQRMLAHESYTVYVFCIFAVLLAVECLALCVGSKIWAADIALPRTIAVFACVVLLPFVCSAGTSNPIVYHATIYSSSLFFLLFGLAAIISRQLRSRLPFLAMLSMTIPFAISQLYDGFVRHPYALCDRLTHQTEWCNLPSLRGVQLSHKSRVFLESINSLLRQNGFQDGDTVLGLYHLPGVIYAVGGTSQGLSWFTPFVAEQDYADRYLSRATLGKHSRLFLIVGWKLEPHTLDALKRAGLEFPNSYKLLGTVQCPVTLGGLDGVTDPNYLNGTFQIYSYSKIRQSKE
jgi:hypothetical protein